MKKATKDWKVVLRDEGLKATPLRIGILEALSASSAPLSVSQLARKVKKYKADAASIYRALGAFVESELVRALPLAGNSYSYELIDEQHGHHIVCTECSAVESIAFCIRSIEVSAKEKSKLFKNISGHTLSFAGTCKKCARAVR